MNDTNDPKPVTYIDTRDGTEVSVISGPNDAAPWKTDFYSTRAAPAGTPRWFVGGVTYWYEGWAGNGWTSDGWRTFLRYHRHNG